MLQFESPFAGLLFFKLSELEVPRQVKVKPFDDSRHLTSCDSLQLRRFTCALVRAIKSLIHLMASFLHVQVFRGRAEDVKLVSECL